MTMQGLRDFLSRLGEIKGRYDRGENVVQYLKSQSGESQNLLNAIAISYDLQAGTYTRFADSNAGYKQEQTACLARTLRNLGPFNSIVEAGVGECTTLAYLLKNLGTYEIDRALGFDISWSRLKYGRAFCERLAQPNVNLFAGNLFEIPLLDDSVDVVYTFHSIEPNGGKEKEALEELYRVTRKYLVLCEPAYDFADESGQARMRSHGFVCDLYPAVRALGYRVLDHRPFEVSYNPLNPTGLTIIEKSAVANDRPVSSPYACPITRTPVTAHPDCYFSEASLLAYPVIWDIPCLLSSHAVIATHFSDFQRTQGTR